MNSRSRGLLYALALSMIGWTGVAHAASFDCKKAASRVEHMICSDPDLDSFDSQLEGAYAGALDRSNHPERLTEEQRAWLKARDACGDAGCMTTAYQQRIAILSKVFDEPANCPGSNTIEMDVCQGNYTQRADHELARYLAAARKRLIGEASENLDPKTSKTALTELDASQKAWETFRKAECDAVYDWWSEGTIRGAMYEGCMQSLTKSRTQQVWETWLSFEDSTPPLMAKPSGK